jgi:hypothetical protein
LSILIDQSGAIVNIPTRASSAAVSYSGRPITPL